MADIIETLKVRPRSSWPRSNDGLYSPSEKLVTQLGRTLELEASKKPSPRAPSRDFDRGKLNYSLRQKRLAKKNLKAAHIFRLSRKNAQEYYLFQRRQALFHQKGELFSHLKSSSYLIFQRQQEESLLFQGHLQRERYYVSNLYEDYLLPLRGRNRVLVDPILHENHFKKAFLAQLHRRHHYYWHLFLRKQRYERGLHFLWSLLMFQVSQREKKAISSPARFRPLLTGSRALFSKEKLKS